MRIVVVAVTLILAAASLSRMPVIAPTRSSPANRNPVFLADSLRPIALAALFNFAESSGIRSSCVRRPLGKPENASRFTPAAARPAMIFAPCPGVFGMSA